MKKKRTTEKRSQKSDEPKQEQGWTTNVWCADVRTRVPIRAYKVFDIGGVKIDIVVTQTIGPMHRVAKFMRVTFYYYKWGTRKTSKISCSLCESDLNCKLRYPSTRLYFGQEARAGIQSSCSMLAQTLTQSLQTNKIVKKMGVRNQLVKFFLKYFVCLSMLAFAKLSY